MRPVSIASFAQLGPSPALPEHDEASLVSIVCREALAEAGLHRRDVGFVCSGSSDWIMGRPFSFVIALDGVGAWPPISESHVEMDGAWALFEAWIMLQCGDIDTALVYAFGKSSLGPVDDVLGLQLDPYTVAPLRPDPLALAALQARALMDAGKATERDFATIVARCRGGDVDALLRAPYVASPLRRHDASTRADGAAAIVLKAGRSGPVIAGIDHRIEPQGLGLRDLTRSVSTALAGRKAGAEGVELAELSACFSHEELLLREALGLGPSVVVNPSGGALAADIPMVTGLVRIGEAARRVREGASRALAHASAGPCLQQNLVCVLEAP